MARSGGGSFDCTSKMRSHSRSWPGTRRSACARWSAGTDCSRKVGSQRWTPGSSPSHLRGLPHTVIGTNSCTTAAPNGRTRYGRQSTPSSTSSSLGQTAKGKRQTANGKPDRHWLTAVIDDYARAICGYTVFTGAPSALNTALAPRQAIWRKQNPSWVMCGLPDILHVDHGSDFTSHHLERTAVALHIRTIHSTVGRPQGRGKIERFFGKINTEALAALPGRLGPGTRGPPNSVLFVSLLSHLVRWWRYTSPATNEPSVATAPNGGSTIGAAPRRRVQVPKGVSVWISPISVVKTANLSVKKPKLSGRKPASTCLNACRTWHRSSSSSQPATTTRAAQSKRGGLPDQHPVALPL